MEREKIQDEKRGMSGKKKLPKMEPLVKKVQVIHVTICFYGPQMEIEDLGSKQQSIKKILMY